MGKEDGQQKRLEQALKILLLPEQYKICEGCDSIVTKKTRICPNCKAYRFKEDIDAVVAHCKILSEREQTTVTEDDLY